MSRRNTLENKRKRREEREAQKARRAEQLAAMENQETNSLDIRVDEMP